MINNIAIRVKIITKYILLMTVALVQLNGQEVKDHDRHFMAGIIASANIGPNYLLSLKKFTIDESARIASGDIVSSLLLWSRVDEVIGDADDFILQYEIVTYQNAMSFYKKFNFQMVLKQSGIELKNEDITRIELILERLRKNGSIYRNFIPPQ